MRTVVQHPRVTFHTRIFPATFAQPYDYPMTDQREHLPQSPRNALSPIGIHRKDGNSKHYLVLAYLDWGHRIDLVPAEVTWTSYDRVRIEWTSATGRRRTTWLPKGHVRRGVAIRPGSAQ